MTFAEWAIHHTTMFGMAAEADLRMVNSWRLPFLAAGYTPDELAEASNWLAVNRAPKFRTEHLVFLQERVNHVRSVALDLARLQTREDTFGVCQLCENSGLVIVPHSRCLVDGVWSAPWLTFAVCCRCIVGRRCRVMSEKLAEEHPQRFRARLQIGDYEAKNPQWFQQLRQRDEAKAMMDKVHAAAAEADRPRRGPSKLDQEIEQLTKSLKETFA